MLNRIKGASDPPKQSFTLNKKSTNNTIEFLNN